MELAILIFYRILDLLFLLVEQLHPDKLWATQLSENILSNVSSLFLVYYLKNWEHIKKYTLNCKFLEFKLHTSFSIKAIILGIAPSVSHLFSNLSQVPRLENVEAKVRLFVNFA